MDRFLAAALGAVLASAGVAKVVGRPHAARGPRRSGASPWRALGTFEIAGGLLLLTVPSRTVVGTTAGFLVAASAYLGVRLAFLDRDACNCWGVKQRVWVRSPGAESVRNALRPTWYFARNGGLMVVAAVALDWSDRVTAGGVGGIWLLLATGTTVSIVRLLGGSPASVSR